MAVVERSKLPLATFELKSLVEEITSLFDNVTVEYARVVEPAEGKNDGGDSYVPAFDKNLL